MLSIANEVDPLIFHCVCFVCEGGAGDIKGDLHTKEGGLAFWRRKKIERERKCIVIL